MFDRDRDLRIPEKSQTLDDGQVLREAGRHSPARPVKLRTR